MQCEDRTKTERLCFSFTSVISKRLQRKQSKSPSPLPPSLSQSLPAEEDISVSSQPAAATEEPAEELLSLINCQVVPEPHLPTPATVLPVPELSKVSLAHPAQEETAVLPVTVFPTSSSATEITEAQGVSTSISVISAPRLEQVTTATSVSLDPVVSSVLPDLSSPAQTLHLQVVLLKCFL